jgi:hypothetical protein
MAKKQTQQTYQDISNRQNTTADQFANTSKLAEGQLGSASNLAGQSRAPLEQGFSQLINQAQTLKGREAEDARDAYDAGQGQHLGSAGGLGTPRYSSMGDVAPVNERIGTSNFDPIYSGFGSIAASGGYSPESRASLGSNIAGLKNIGATGGLDANAMNRMRGGGVYDEAAANGLYSPEAQANIKRQALSPISAYRTNMGDELARRRSVQGGYTPGFDATNRALSRDTSRQIADTSLNANVMLQDKINANRMAGASGMAGAETGLQGLRTGNMLSGLTSAGNQEMAMNNSIAGNQLAGLGGMRGTASDIADIQGRNIGFGFQNAGIQGQNIDRANNLYLAGLGGMQNLYGSDVGQQQNALAAMYGMPGAAANAQQGYLGARTNLATQPGTGMNIFRGLTSAAGAMAPMFTGGFGSMPNSSGWQTPTSTNRIM